MTKYRETILVGGKGDAGGRGKGGVGEETLKKAFMFDPEMFEALVRDFRVARESQKKAGATLKCQHWVDTYVNELESSAGFGVGKLLEKIILGDTGNGLKVGGIGFGNVKNKS